MTAKLCACIPFAFVAACGAAPPGDGASSSSAVGDVAFDVAPMPIRGAPPQPPPRHPVVRPAGARQTEAASTGHGIAYRGGPVMSGTVSLYYVWYGSWGNDAVSILTDFADTIGASPSYDVDTSYDDAQGNHVGGAVRFGGSTTDAYSRGQTINNGDIWTIVDQSLSSGALPVDPNGVYVVLTSADVNETDGFCSANCGWHSANTFDGSSIKFAFVGGATRCGGSCGSLGPTPNGNADADDMASIVFHELSETVTDPVFNGWADSGENADKCAWQFGPTYTTPNGAAANARLGHRDFLLQEIWANAGAGFCAQTLPPAAGTAYSLTSIHSGLALNVTGGSTSDGAPVIQWPYGGYGNDQWRLTDAGGGSYELVSVHSGLCLEVPQGSQAAGADVDQRSCTGGAGQLWRLNAFGGRFQVVSASSGQCLNVLGASTSAGASVIQWPCAGADNELWMIMPVDAPPLGGSLRVTSASSGLVLDVTGASTSSGAPLQQWAYGGSANQLWQLVPSGGAAYELVSVGSALCADVPGGSQTPGTATEQWTCHAGANQQWRLSPLGAGYQVIGVGSGQCLNVAGASTSDGASIIEWPCAGGANEIWTFDAVQ
jgi:hypothetical protein